MNKRRSLKSISIVSIATTAVIAAIFFLKSGQLSYLWVDPDQSSFLGQSLQPADSLFALNRYVDAEREFRLALADTAYQKIPPTIAYIQFRLGKSLTRMGREAEAKQPLLSAYKFYRKKHDAYGVSETAYTLGFVTNRLGESEASEKFYLEAIKNSKATGKYALLTDALANLGLNYNLSGENHRAETCYYQVLELARANGDTVTLIKSYVNLASIKSTQKDYEGAIAQNVIVLELSRKFGNKSLEAGVLERSFTNYKESGRFADGMECYQAALAIYTDRGQIREQIALLQRMSGAYRDQGQVEKGMPLMHRALESARATGDSLVICSVLNNLGEAYLNQTKITKAIECNLEAIAIGNAIENGIMASDAHIDLGLTYIWLGDAEQAREHLQTSLDICRSLNDNQGIGISLLKLGSVDEMEENYQGAIEHYASSIKPLTDSDKLSQVCEALWKTGDAYESLGDDQKADDQYQLALKLAREIDDPIRESWVLYRLGELALKRSDVGTALDLAERAIQKAKTTEFPEELGKFMLILKGRCQVRQTKYRSALEVFDIAMIQSETVRGELELDRDKRNYASTVALLFDEKVYCHSLLGQDNEAFESAERGKSRAFLDLMATGWLEGKEEQSKTDDVDKLLRSQLATPYGIADLKRMLPKETTLLEYYQSDSILFLWVINQESFKAYRLPAPRTAVDALVRELREVVRTPGGHEELLSSLYSTVVSTALDGISSKNLVVVPHGTLHYLPFQALRNEEDQCLLELYNISYLPSASVLGYLDPEHRKFMGKLLALGAPAIERNDYGALPFAAEEVRAIGSLLPASNILLGKDASEADFRNLAVRYDLLHFACHNEFKANAPMQAGLLLSPGKGQDGKLEVGEVFELELNAYLVVLSGCETGMGNLSGGDDLIGLSRAFIFAGTPALVASLWQVADESTCYLMTQFYGNITSHGRAEALRLAQLSTRKKYPNLFNWAPFILIGEGV